MGTCTYTLSKLCSTNSSLPYFNVEAANEHRSGNAHVSYVRHVTVEVFNHRIVLGKGRVVKVDGEVAVLPMSVTSEVLVALSGQYVVITTSFGLRVKFNGRHRAEVTLPSPFKGKVCGLCGNYNDDRRDDFLNPDGIMEPDSVSFGNSWQTPNDTRCTPDVGVRPNCTSEEKRIIESNQYCGIIVDLHGPFKGCHSKIDPEVYFDDCVYDLCALGTETGSLCSSLESYGDACQSAGAKVEGWRNETFCPLKCGANSHYEQCGSACPATCASPSAPSSCLQPCVEGCVCDSGYLFYNDRCVPKHQCGCWSEGKHYPVGSEFWTDDTCSTQCRCPSAGSQMVCSNSTCSRDSYCGVVNGVPGCYPYTYGICRVHNDPHYNTFDKATLHFMGSCTYTIAKLCGNSSSLPHFNIEAKNENRGNPKVSYVQRVQVAVRDHKVWIVKMEPHRVLVDEVWATLPVQLAEGAVSVRRSGRYVVLSTDFGLHVSYDTDHSVEVKVPSTYFNQTCGMCGNYNGMRGDDYMKPDGEQAKDSNELGNSWKVPPFEPGCDPDEGEEECQPADEARYRSDEFCGLITSQQGPFVNCHSVISAHGIFESCVVELCLLDGDRVALCNSLQIYADACQSAGVTVLPWRNATFCDVMCPANSHYNACASACPTTCTDRSASANCSEPCVEDCECNAGFVLSGSSCVPVENCGCTHNNQYYEKGAMFWEDGCREKCRCTGNDRVECEPGSCGAGEICKVQGGIWGCYRPDTAICHIYGDPHYTTFDGKLYHFQGACNYTVTETCGNSSVRFSLTSRNEHRGNPTWSAINSVGLRLDNLHIALRKNKRVYVDGERVELPVRPIPSVKVTLLGSFVLLETDFGLQVKFDGDQQLVVVVDERYQGQLCGLCGTYTNDQLDDFLKPDGILALDSNQFGNSWAVADDDWQCNQTAPVPPTCDPPSQEEAERYCKIVLDNPGPFEECHWHIPPQLYFESCVYDHCVTGGDSVQLCNTLASYASACEAAGVVLGDWRQQSGCFEKSCALDCNFDSDLCRWTQSKTDTLDWKRISGSTPSFNTGPAFDHTTAGGYYVYLEGNDGKPGDRAQLISAPCVKSGAQCMRFWYHMYGVAQSMALNVYQVDQGAAVLKWSKSGNQGNSWIAGEVDLYLSGHSQILLEAVRGNDYRSDVAVDDISFHVGCCEEGCGISTTSTTTTSTTSTTTSTTTTTTSTSTITSSRAPEDTGRGTCSASGDPHYNTFDSRVHHFMGTCTYLLSKLCSEASGLPYFDVSATNEHRGTNTKVSWVNSVHVSVHNNTISIMKSHKVMLNGERVNLPVSVMDLVMVRRSGVYVSLETNFGLWVRFDGIHHVDVSVPSEYSGLLCGICGNYNGDRKDDIIMPNGSFAADSNMLGESWQVHNGETECNHVGSDFKCDPKVMENAEKNTACGMITDLTGLFKECHAKVLPKNYFDNCVYDMCMDGGQSPTLCFALQTYSDLCTQAGVCTEWRNNTFCSLTCPIGSHYETCGTGCPATCMHPSAPDTCLVPTVEGCFCDPGYILSVDKCIPSSQCGCTYNNRYYQMYESWFTNGNCTERCTCLGKNVSVCSAWKCGLHEKCERWNGELGCQMAGSASCHIAGGTHYYTFDKIMYSFSGTCAYTLVKMCDSSSVIPVNVSVLNEGQGQLPSSYLREIFIDVFGIRLTLQKNRRMLLDGVRTRSPIKGLLKGINVITNGLNTIIETDFGMSVKFDDNQNLEISLPKSYYSKVCGLCGDYNGQQANEFQMPNGNIASSANHFGNSWKTEEFGSQGCLSRDQVDFPCTLRERLIIESQCKDLLSNKYRSCHALVNPDFFIKNCVQDMCKYHGLLPALCDNIQHYADVCKKEGAELKWRNSTFCPLHCPPKSSYVTCAPACPPTCDNIYGGSSCNKTSVCMEGCACNHGFVQSDVSCVPISECGCRDTNNHYHPVGEIWLTQHCTQVCICKEGGEINCSAHGCELNEVCSLKRNGQYICRPTGFNKCTGGGNPYYLAFDGLIHRFMGENLTTLAETSGIPDRLQEFRILGKNAPLKEKKKAAHLQEVIIEVYGHTVQFKEKQRLVVDDELVNPPIQPHDGLLIYQRSNRFHLETDFGLAVSFQEKANADITVPISYTKWVRGQCSNFSGKSKNDLMQSDGTRNVEVYTSGKSSKDDKNRPPAGVPETTNRQRKHPITDENPESIESDPGFDSQCSKTELTVLNTARYCGIISDPDGPFGSCHQFISPEQYQINCISSICTLMNVTEWLCLTLEQYALHCQEQGVTLGEWRDDTHCEMACPENSQYSIQMSACPASCGNLGAPSECEAPAMEGCECMPGFVLSGFQCVPYKKCGCTYRNKYYEVGERFITEDCDETCECVGTATVHCTKMPCAPNTTCTTANHIRGCY